MELIRTDVTAVETLRTMVTGLDVCMLITTDAEGHRHNRQMAAIRIDDEGNCWFFASKGSGKLRDLANNNKLQVVFADPGKNNYVEIHGIAEVICDQQQLARNWSPLVSEWFPRGIDDPRVCLVRVDTTNVFYWDERCEGIQRLQIRTLNRTEDDRKLAA